MLIQELKEKEPLELVEVSQLDESSKNNIERKIIETKVFTDGIIEEIIEKKPHFVKEFFIQKLIFDNVFVKPKKITIKNYHYIITSLTVNESKNKRYYNTIKDIKIYLRDKNDKKALIDAKNAIKTIVDNNKLSDSSFFSTINNEPLEKYDFLEREENIYTLGEHIYEKK